MPPMTPAAMSEHLLWLLDDEDAGPGWDEPILVTRRELTAALTLFEFLYEDLRVIPVELADAVVRLSHDIAMRDPEIEAASERIKQSRSSEPPQI